MKKIVFLLFVFFHTSAGFSQAPKEKDLDSIFVWLDAHAKIPADAEGVDLCNIAIEILEKLDSKKDLALAYHNKAFNQLFSGDDLQDTLTTINTAIDIYKTQLTRI